MNMLITPVLLARDGYCPMPSHTHPSILNTRITTSPSKARSVGKTIVVHRIPGELTPQIYATSSEVNMESNSAEKYCTCLFSLYLQLLYSM